IDAEFRIGLVDSSCVEEREGDSMVYSYYCDENCDMETGMGELSVCIMIGQERTEKVEEEDLDRSRLVLSIIMPILFFFIIVIVVACGFCFLFK
ncbi:hypothetical protein PMAYCL1PPCAC_19320, partial [Pristionchus mayeri]